MTNDELRALADALHWVQYTADWQACDQAADYLRAQADAQGAMLDSHRRLVEQAIQSAEHPSGMSTHDGKARIDASILRRMLAIIDSLPAVPQADALPVSLVRAYNAGYMAGHHDTVEGGFVDIHPSDMDTYHADVVAELGLPAAPQAEPIADSDADYWLRNRQAILDAIERAGFALMSNASGFWLHPRGTTAPQAEPKPTPASGDDLNVYKEMADNYRNDAQAEPKRGPLLGELMREQRQSRIVAGVYPDGNPNAGAMMAQTRQAEPKREDQPLRNLLAIIHCDGGHHTEAVGIERSITDALAAVIKMKSKLAMAKREPLTYEQLVSACYTYRHDFGLLDPDEQHLVIEEAGRWAKAFGIGGSDAE